MFNFHAISLSKNNSSFFEDPHYHGLSKAFQLQKYVPWETFHTTFGISLVSNSTNGTLILGTGQTRSNFDVLILHTLRCSL